jgi:plastocyanin
MKKFVFTLLMGLLLAGCGSVFQAGPTPTPTLDPQAPEINITLSDFSFTPNRIKLKVGQNVTFHVRNSSATDHELMIGRNPLRDESGQLGDGFEHDFFALTQPKVTGEAQVMGMEGAGMDMSMGTATPEGEMAMGSETPSAEMGGMQGMDEAEMENGFMAMLGSEQEADISFTVTEDMLGTWTMGCFETSQGIVHFDEGMVGNVIVLE